MYPRYPEIHGYNLIPDTLSVHDLLPSKKKNLKNFSKTLDLYYIKLYICKV